jgi:predicted phosphodiesterase
LQNLKFRAQERNIFITHIGGTPGHYDKRVREGILQNPPDIFICGHSHIAKVMHDKKTGLLYINPGAAGYNGFHKYMTIIRLQIDGKDIHDLELIELGERGKVTL